MNLRSLKRIFPWAIPHITRLGRYDLGHRVPVIEKSTEKIFHTDSFCTEGPNAGKIWICELSTYMLSNKFELVKN